MENTVVIVPVLNEEKRINKFLDEFKKIKLKKIIVVLDPRTNDKTEWILKRRRIKYLYANEKGYDQALNDGVGAIKRFFPGVKYVLLAGSGNRYGLDAVRIFLDRLESGADLVLGCRGDIDKRMTWYEKTGTRLMLLPIRIFFGKKIKDISPVRMIRYELLKNLDLHPNKFRWMTEMLIKCLALNLRIDEIPLKSKPGSGNSGDTVGVVDMVIAVTDMFKALQFIGFELDEKIMNKLSKLKP